MIFHVYRRTWKELPNMTTVPTVLSNYMLAQCTTAIEKSAYKSGFRVLGQISVQRYIPLFLAQRLLCSATETDPTSK